MIDALPGELPGRPSLYMIVLIAWFTWCSLGPRLRSGPTLTWHHSDTLRRPAALSPGEHSTVWVYTLRWPVSPAGTRSNCQNRVERERQRSRVKKYTDMRTRLGAAHTALWPTSLFVGLSFGLLPFIQICHYNTKDKTAQKRKTYEVTERQDSKRASLLFPTLEVVQE